MVCLITNVTIKGKGRAGKGRAARRGLEQLRFYWFYLSVERC
jgi:hypothetical protein